MITQDIVQQIRAATTGVQITDIAKLVDEYILWTQHNCAPKTNPARKSRLSKMVRFLNAAGVTDIAEFNSAVLAIYLDNGLPDLEPSSKNADIKAIKGFVSWVEDSDPYSIFNNQTGAQT